MVYENPRQMSISPVVNTAMSVGVVPVYECPGLLWEMTTCPGVKLQPCPGGVTTWIRMSEGKFGHVRGVNTSV